MSNYNRFQEKLKTQEERLEDRARKELTRKPIAKVSEKRKKDNVELEKIKKRLKKVIQHCQIKSPVCTNGPLRSHHITGRSGPSLTNARKIMMVCDACNGYVSDHPGFAYAHGFSESRTGTPEKFKHLTKTNHT